MGTTTEPVYLRVLEDLRTRIRSGALEPGARVPSRNAIIANYGVGETAAKHALQVLTAEGLIEARAGSGSYVRKLPAVTFLDRDRPQFPGSPFGVHESVQASRRLAWEHQTEQLAAPAVVAARLGIEEGTLVTATRYLLTSDSEPVQLAISYEPAAVTAGTEIAVPEQGPLAGRGVIERMRSIGIEVDQLVEEVSFRPALRAEAELLAAAAGEIVIAIDRVHYADGQAIEAGQVVVPALRYKLRYRFGVAADQAARNQE